MQLVRADRRTKVQNQGYNKCIGCSVDILRLQKSVVVMIFAWYGGDVDGKLPLVICYISLFSNDNISLCSFDICLIYQ